MIRKTFVFEIGRDHDRYYLQKAQAAAQAAGAEFSGSPRAGSFSHRGVHGLYRADGGRITVDLDKPIGLPWGPMERALERFFDPPECLCRPDADQRLDDSCDPQTNNRKGREIANEHATRFEP